VSFQEYCIGCFPPTFVEKDRGFAAAYRGAAKQSKATATVRKKSTDAEKIGRKKKTKNTLKKKQ